MAEIAHSYTDLNGTTADTHTGDTAWTTVADTTIASGSFTATREYLILVVGFFGGDSLTASFGFRVAHGGAAFDGSTMIAEPRLFNSSLPYQYFNVWTAVASEAITCEFQDVTNTTDTVNANFVSVLAIDIPEDLTKDTDWHSSVDTDNETLLNGTWTTTQNASVTFTPGTADNRWLVLGTCKMDPAGATNVNILARVLHGSDGDPTYSREPESNSDELVMSTARVYTLAASSQTFTQEAQKDGATGDPIREYSAVFALNLDKFDVVSLDEEYTTEDVLQDVTPYGDQINSASITPNTTGDVFALAYWIFDAKNVRACLSRLQAGNVDLPTGQTTYEQDIPAFDASDDIAIAHLAMNPSQSGAVTYDVDASVGNDANSSSAIDRFVVLWTAELKAAGGGNAMPMAQDSYHRRRSG